MKKKITIAISIITAALATGCSTNSAVNIKQSDEYIALQKQYAQTDQARVNAETELQRLLREGGSETTSLLPPNPKAGECYARVVIPAKYENKQQTIKTSPERSVIKTLPARYEWVEEQVMTKESYEKLEVIPATYKMVDEKVLVAEAGEKLVHVPAEYKTVSEQVLIKPAHTAWKKGRGPIEKVDSITGEIMCLVDVPAEYKTVSKQVLVSAEQVDKVEIPAQYKTIQKRVVDTPATTRTVVVPAQYKNLRVRKMVEGAKQDVSKIPAEYKTITQREKVADAYLEWRPILCETNTKPALISELQHTLQGKGYNPGVIDGVLGPDTMSAVVSYQNDNKLPSGKLTIQTLKSLGIEL